jgi:hypothetical protein
MSGSLSSAKAPDKAFRIFRYGPHESVGQIREGLDQYIVSSNNLSVRARSVVHLPALNETS